MFSFFDVFGRYIMSAMQYCNDNVFFSYVLTLIIFTGLIKILTLPFDIKQRTNTAKMTALQPELKALQKRYASNPETLQKKTMELYKENHYNQLAGCLPMLAMMVFFIVFVSAARQWAQLHTIQLYLDPTLEHFGNYKWLWIHNIWMPDSWANTIMPYAEFAKIPFDNFNKYFSPEIISQLKGVTEQAYKANFDTIITATSNFKNGWCILPFVAGGSMLITNLLSQKVNPQQTSPQPGGQSMAGMSSTMMYAFAGLSVYICMTSNAAFAIYWIASNIFSIISTLALNYKTLFKPKEEGSKEA